MSEMFSNGTEGEAWMARWCDVCDNDHGADSDKHCDDCDTIWMSMTPECIILEPEGVFHMPPAHICTRFAARPEGDPWGSSRPGIVAYVKRARAGAAHE